MSSINNPENITTTAPVGSILMWPTATPPTDWLICDGSTFSGVTYPDLATLLGGTTLPNITNRFPLGIGAEAPLVTGGTLFHDHTQPTHTHTGPDHNHTITHTHAVDPPNTTSTSAGGHTHATAGGHTHDNHTTASVGILGLLSPGLNGPTTHSNQGGHAHDTIAGHTHNTDIASFISGGSSAANTGNAGTGNTGSGGGDTTGAQFNIPPYLRLNFIIKAA